MSQALQQQTKEIVAIKQYLETAKDKLAEVLPKYLTPERLVRVAVAAMSRQPKIALCTRESILLAIMEAGQLGLEAGSPLGHAYLVPFENRRSGRTDCTLILGYKGLLELARRSGQVASAEARVVYAGDHFECEFGLHPRLVHRPNWTAKRGQPALAYAVIRMKGDDTDAVVEVMNLDDIERVRARSRAANEGPWVTDWEMMARKTVLRRALKWAPMPASEAEAVARDDENDVIDVPAVTIEATPEPTAEPTPPSDPRAETIKERLRSRKRVQVEGPNGENLATATAEPVNEPAPPAPPAEPAETH